MLFQARKPDEDKTVDLTDKILYSMQIPGTDGVAPHKNMDVLGIMTTTWKHKARFDSAIVNLYC
jgi:hypothetical protein